MRTPVITAALLGLVAVAGGCKKSVPATSQVADDAGAGDDVYNRGATLPPGDDAGYVAPPSCITGGRVTGVSPSVDANTQAQSWLAFSAHVGGAPRHTPHVDQKHIYMTNDALKARIDNEHVRAASTFASPALAEALIDNAITTNHDKVVQWLQSPTDDGDNSDSRKLALTGTCNGQVCGVTMSRDYSVASETGGTVVLYKECLSDGMGFYILTAYPGY